MANFGQTVPITGPLTGFPGKNSRMGKTGIASRQVLLTTPNPIPFGAPVVMIPDSLGGTYQSVADFILGGGTFTAAKFAGIAVSEVNAGLVLNPVPGSIQVGSYAPGDMCDVKQEGSLTVQLLNPGTPVAEGPVYVRVLLNGSVPAGLVGDLEGAADGSNSILIPGVVFRTGVVDTNGVAEITILNRVAA
jgi:hypothetical protein